MSTLEISVDEIVTRYFEAWNAPAEQRQAATAAAYTADAYYCDGATEAVGVDAIVAMMDGVMTQFAGTRFDLVSPIDHHHGQARFEWAMTTADGERILDGIDAIRFTDDGLISQVLGFFGTSVPSAEPAVTTQEFRWERTYPVSSDQLFAAVTDLDLYADVAPNLASIQVLEGDGVGMVRQCTNPEGESWTETYTEWVPGERVVTVVDVSTYPPSLAAMIKALTMTVNVESVDATTSKVVVDIVADLTDAGVRTFRDGGAADGLFIPILDGWDAALA